VSNPEIKAMCASAVQISTDDFLRQLDA